MNREQGMLVHASFVDQKDMQFVGSAYFLQTNLARLAHGPELYPQRATMTSLAWCEIVAITDRESASRLLSQVAGASAGGAARAERTCARNHERAVDQPLLASRLDSCARHRVHVSESKQPLAYLYCRGCRITSSNGAANAFVVEAGVVYGQCLLRAVFY